MPANEYRGEVDVEIAGRGVVLRPTFSAMVAIEKELGLSMSKLYRKLGELDIGAQEIAAIIRHGAKAAGENVSNAEVEVAMRRGLIALLKPASQFIINAMQGGNDPEDAEKNAAAPATDSPIG